MYNKPDGVSLEIANKELVTFAFTRHPFQRLVSAYTANCVNRTECVQRGIFNGSSGPMKFAEYAIENILEYHMKYGPDPKSHSGYSYFTLHFIPQYLACPYCQLEFDLVGKLEDMERHAAFLAEHLGLKVIVYYMRTFISIQHTIVLDFCFCPCQTSTLQLTSYIFNDIFTDLASLVQFFLNL